MSVNRRGDDKDVEHVDGYVVGTWSMTLMNKCTDREDSLTFNKGLSLT